MIFCPSKSLYHQNYIKKQIKRTIKLKEYIDMMSIFLRPSKLCRKVISKTMLFFSSSKLQRSKLIESASILRSLKLQNTSYLKTTSSFYPSKSCRENYVETSQKFINHLIATKNRRRFNIVCLLGNQLKLLTFQGKKFTVIAIINISMLFKCIMEWPGFFYFQEKCVLSIAMFLVIYNN